MGVQTRANMMKLISTLALVAVASAQYAPAPVVKVVREIPQPYAYEYGVADDYSKANFRKTETQDAAGNVGGSFTIALPDGRIQTTTYTADHTNGLVAEVTYSGEAVYPPAPAGGYPGEAHAPRTWIRSRQEIDLFFKLWWQSSDPDSLHKDNTVMIRFQMIRFKRIIWKRIITVLSLPM